MIRKVYYCPKLFFLHVATYYKRSLRKRALIIISQGAMGWAYQGGIDDRPTLDQGLAALKGRTDKALVNFPLL